MAKKKIPFELSEDSISKACRELEQYKVAFTRKVFQLRDRVAECLADEASLGFTGAVVDDLVRGGQKLADVKVSISDRGSLIAIIASGEDAVWVEFGAGVHHNGSPGSSPHPKGAELGFTIGTFGLGMGKRKVWGYYEDGELKVTRGTPATMPMYRAVQTVCADIREIAREVFG